MRRAGILLYFCLIAQTGCTSDCYDDAGVACDDPARAQYEVAIDPPTFIVGGSTPPSVINYVPEFEVVPARIPTATGTRLYSAMSAKENSATSTTWSDWNRDTYAPYVVPEFDPPNFCSRGDAWAAPSISNNLVYVSFIGHANNDCTSPSCLSMAATTPANIASNIWTYPQRCVANSPSDQPAIVFEENNDTLYAASKNAGIRLNAWRQCTTFPGTTGCGTSSAPVWFGPNTLQFGIDTNPCTGHLAIAYRDGSTVRIRFYDQFLVQQGVDSVVRLNQYWGSRTNPECVGGVHTVRRCRQGAIDCGAINPNDCMRNNARISLGITQDGPNCYAAIAYDFFPSSASTGYIRAGLDIMSVTNESAPTGLQAWV